MVLFALGSLTVLLDLVGEGTGVDGDAGNANVADWVQGISSGVSAVLIGIGLAVRHRSRVAAYRWFKAAIMVSLLVTQVFVFYHDQLAALIGVILDLLLYAGLTYMIGREEAHRDAAQAPAAAPAAAPVA
jgi:hypothetical protein